MIPRSTIKAFLRRPLRDCNAYKSLSKEQLDARMERLPVQPPIWFKLYHHQKVCFIAGAKLKRLYYSNDTGTGKTLLSVALIRYFNRLKSAKCTLVLVPTKIVKYEWAREIAKHSPKTTYCVLAGSSQQKWETLSKGNHMIAITTYAGLLRMVCTLGTIKRKNKPDRNGLIPDKRKLKDLLSIVNGLVMDEATAVKTRGKLPFRICRQISKQAEIVFALSGTPFDDPSDLWAQMYLVDRGETLGKTLGLFRSVFFNSKPNYWGGMEYTFKQSMTGELRRILANRSLGYEANAADLPQVVPIQKNIKLPVDASVYAERTEQMLLNAHGDYRMMKNAFLRMRQISAGFLGYYDDDEGTKARFEFDDTPKLDLLMSIIESIRPDHKIIIFHEFIHSADMIARELAERRIKCIRIYGKTKEHAKLLHQFDHDPLCRVMLLQNNSGLGLNTQIARYGIFYESPVTPSMRKQTRRRVERQGSQHERVFIYDLVVTGTYDQRILNALANGEDAFKAIMRGRTPVP
jgi:SNF2 family DNA or RNA helicase